jgi:hypothetical protein
MAAKRTRMAERVDRSTGRRGAFSRAEAGARRTASAWRAMATNRLRQDAWWREGKRFFMVSNLGFEPPEFRCEVRSGSPDDSGKSE